MSQKYLTELIGEEYRFWGPRKIIIKAPTGIGKTTFVIQKLIPYHTEKGKKVLILCNRRLLREQYWYALVEQFLNDYRLSQLVEIKTYQELAGTLSSLNQTQVEHMLREYSLVCLDEIHYFWSDSDFNGFGTFALFHALILAGLTKQMIFMSATADCIIDYIFPALVAADRYLKERYPSAFVKHPVWEAGGEEYSPTGYLPNEEYLDVITKDYMSTLNFEHLNCIHVPDLKTACEKIAISPKKTIVFVDDKVLAEKIVESIKAFCDFDKQDIAVLNSDNADSGTNSKVVQNLCLVNKLIPKVLVTTSVLDNGVSVKDADVGNLLILTENQVSFMQMLGRIRVEGNQQIKLYFVSREQTYYQRMEEKYKKAVGEFKRFTKIQSEWELLRLMFFEDVDVISNLRRCVIVAPKKHEYLKAFLKNYILYEFEDSIAYLNAFAIAKTEQLYFTFCNFHISSLESENAPIVKMLDWVGKQESDLIYETAEYVAEREKMMLDTLNKIQNVSNGELQRIKIALSKDFRKEFFSEIVAKSGSFSNEKLKEILKKYGLILISKSDGAGRLTYSVRDYEDE